LQPLLADRRSGQIADQSRRPVRPVSIRIVFDDLDSMQSEPQGVDGSALIRRKSPNEVNVPSDG
jgi:hypothetical protein